MCDKIEEERRIKLKVDWYVIKHILYNNTKGMRLMPAYRAYYENGRIIPLGNPAIPEGSEIILTVLESQTESRAKQQRKAFQKFMTTMANTPPLTDEFDKIISRRVNIRREVEL